MLQIDLEATVLLRVVDFVLLSGLLKHPLARDSSQVPVCAVQPSLDSGCV